MPTHSTASGITLNQVISQYILHLIALASASFGNHVTHRPKGLCMVLYPLSYGIRLWRS